MTMWRWIRGLACVVCALYLGACATEPGARSAAPDAVKLRVLALPLLSSAALLIAADGGHFAAEGLDIEFVRMTRSADALVAVSRGELDVWVGAVSVGLLNALARDDGISVVSDRMYFGRDGCTYGALMVRRTLAEAGEISGPADLRGRRVALNPVSTQAYVTDRLLAQAGLTLEDITIADIPDGAVLADALRSGAVDAAFVFEPWVTRVLEAGTAVIVARAEQVVPDFQHMVTVFGPSLLVRHPDAGRRYMRAYLAGLEQYREGKTPRNVAILARHTGLDKETLRKACWPSVRADASVRTADMLDFQAWGLKKRVLDRALPASRLWNRAVVDSAVQAR